MHPLLGEVDPDRGPLVLDESPVEAPAPESPVPAPIPRTRRRDVARRVVVTGLRRLADLLEK